MKYFLSCDWGTSSFRLYLAERETCSVVAASESAQGIRDTFTSWNKTGDSDAGKRVRFYAKVIHDHIRTIEQKTGFSLSGAEIVISGMASSSIGIMDVAYQQLPFAVDGSGVTTTYLEASPDFPYSILLISGVRSTDDVMRGEETQLVGCCFGRPAYTGPAIYIFPGTHSKHIMVKDGQMVDFTTYMTGEYFELLATQSVLKASVETGSTVDPQAYLPAFRQGVLDSLASGILHAAFKVRTKNLFGIFSKKESYFYLSGLLIGTELQELSKHEVKQAFLCCGSKLKLYYETAFEALGLSPSLRSLPAETVDSALVRGQYMILKKTTQ